MTTIPLNHPGRLRAGMALHEWPLRWTLCGAAMLAVLVFILGAQGLRGSGLIDRDASLAALAAAEAKVADAQRIETELPELRQRVERDRLQPENWSAADALHALAYLATQSGLHVTDIEPASAGSSDRAVVRPQTQRQPQTQTQPQPQTQTQTQPHTQPQTQNQTERVLKFHAEGAFPEVKRFVEALAGLPRLVVPEGVQIRRQNGAISIDTALRIHGDLAAVPLPEPLRADAFVIDPFGKGDPGGFSRNGDLLLVGTLLARHGAMALMQSKEGIDDFRPGQRIGGEWLTRVRPREVELASNDGVSHTISFAEDRK